MPGTILLIDYENVQKVDLSQLPFDTKVRIFVGMMQKKVPTLLARQAQVLGPRLEWIQIEGQGSNALDFHIAHYLGRFVLEEPKARHVILSKDKGFDPLVKHLNGQGYQCERIGQLTGLPKFTEPTVKKSAPSPKAKKSAQPSKVEKPSASFDTNFQRAIDLLRKIEKTRRPHTRSKLTKWVVAAFQNKLSQTEVDRILKKLVANGLVTETNKGLSYKL